MAAGVSLEAVGAICAPRRQSTASSGTIKIESDADRDEARRPH